MDNLEQKFTSRITQSLRTQNIPKNYYFLGVRNIRNNNFTENFALILRDHSFSTCAKVSGKLTFLTS